MPRSKINVNVLSTREQGAVTKARKAAIKAGDTVKVGGYERVFYYIADRRVCRLRRWDDLAVALQRLCRDRDVYGPQHGDAKRAQEVIDLLDDTFRRQGSPTK